MIATITALASTLAPFTTAAALLAIAWAGYLLLPAFLLDVADLWVDLKSEEN